MLTYASTLPAGPYDWNADVLSKAEFDARIAATRHLMAEHGVSALAVYGSTLEHGALAYLTNFVPKLGFALAFLPAQDDLRLVFSLGDNMRPAFRRLTWVEHVEPMGNLATQLAQQFSAMATPDGLALGLWGTSHMPSAIYNAILEAIAPLGFVRDIEPLLYPLLRRKSQREKALILDSALILDGAFDWLRRDIAAGWGRRTAALGVEREAYRLGAQDVRVLMSARPGGPPLCVDDAQNPRIDPLNAYIAVRFRGYWTEGQATLASVPKPLHEAAKVTLADSLDAIRPGAAPAVLLRRIDAALLPYHRSLAEEPVVSGYTGLSLDESMRCDGSSPLAEGDLTLVRIAALDGDEYALASAIVEIDGDGAKPLVRASLPAV